MKNVFMGLLTFLLVCSTALNVFMFVQLEKLLGSSPQTQISSTVNPSTPENNATLSNFNTALIGTWTDGRKTKFHVMTDGTAYESTHTEWEGSGGEFVYSIEYGYMDGNNFVVKQVYTYNTVMNGGDGIYRHSDEEVIANCLFDVSVHTYRIVLEGDTITGFGDTNRQYVRDDN